MMAPVKEPQQPRKDLTDPDERVPVMKIHRLVFGRTG